MPILIVLVRSSTKIINLVILTDFRRNFELLTFYAHGFVLKHYNYILKISCNPYSDLLHVSKDTVSPPFVQGVGCRRIRPCLLNSRATADLTQANPPATYRRQPCLVNYDVPEWDTLKYDVLESICLNGWMLIDCATVIMWTSFFLDTFRN